MALVLKHSPGTIGKHLQAGAVPVAATLEAWLRCWTLHALTVIYQPESSELIQARIQPWPP